MDKINDLERKRLDNYEPSDVKKIAIGVIDTAIGFGLLFFIGNYVLPNKLWNSWTDDNPFLVLIIGILLYRVLCVMTLKATLGMIVLKTKFLNKNYEELISKEKFFGAIFIPYNGVKLFDNSN